MFLKFFKTTEKIIFDQSFRHVCCLSK